ncbi:hypothetical protein AVEN_62528-1 [Araneus ventricosus]|uniref:Uncharacterized protein n=1 Tax=Araneus ventricosus TaxID=182803 RepID=A0A4Y2TCI1_ARAVE|nr:hypothetical protein AVEN_62528-1 [Araneus ventricosus]
MDDASSGRSTPSSWEGSQQSISSSLSLNFNTITTPEQKTCSLLVEKDAQWRRLDRELHSHIKDLERLHNTGQGNSPACIQLTMKRRDCQDMIEFLEDELLRIESCPNSQCLVHQTEKQVRSTRSDEANFKTVSPKKAAKIKKT